MVIKSLHTYLCRLSLGSSWAGPFLLCRGSAYSFDSTPQGHLLHTFFAAASGCWSCKKADPGFYSCPPLSTPKTALHGNGARKNPGLPLSLTMFCLISHPISKGRKWSSAEDPRMWCAWHQRTHSTKGMLPHGTGGILHNPHQDLPR